jgi:hypothetical protein
MQEIHAGDQQGAGAAAPATTEGFLTRSRKVTLLYGRDLERFLAKVDVQGRFMPGMKTRCHEWLGHRDKDGYGQFWLSGTNRRATFAALLLKGIVLKVGQQALHRCDNPACVRLTHLRAGTSRQNVADRVRKGRTASGDAHWTRRMPERVLCGDKHPLAKFSNAQVVQLRTTPSASSKRKLAREHDVAPAVMRRMLKGDTWKSL